MLIIYTNMGFYGFDGKKVQFGAKPGKPGLSGDVEVKI